MSTRLQQILVFSVVVLAGACRVQDDRLESGVSPNNDWIDMEMAQTVEKKWAERLDLPGVPNLYKVSEDLYRGAQPSAEGMRQLETLGIKTVVNLRFILSDRGKLKGTGLDYEHINMTTLHVRTTDVVRFLKIVTDRNRTPVFVHCHHGIDRTGTMCAVYRIIVQKWSKDEAIEEMTKGSFAFRNVYKNLVNDIRKLDVDRCSRVD
jgi:protein tyrosine phosphatase (PTP) superfamily phosphohydrolase (DUF442 family)